MQKLAQKNLKSEKNSKISYIIRLAFVLAGLLQLQVHAVIAAAAVPASTKAEAAHISKRTYRVKSKDAEKLLCMAMSDLVYSDRLEEKETLELGAFYGTRELTERGFNTLYKDHLYLDLTMEETVYKSDFYDAVKLDQWRIGPSLKEENGFFGAAFYHTESKEIIIVYRGTTLSEYQDVITDAMLAMGSIGSQFRDAVRLYDQVKDTIQRGYLKGYTVKCLTGHSLGGALANYVSIYKGIRTITFSAPSITFQTFGDMAVRAYEGIVQGDYRSDILPASFTGVDNLKIVDYSNYHDIIGVFGETYDMIKRRWNPSDHADQHTVLLDCYGHETEGPFWSHYMESMLVLEGNTFRLTDVITDATGIGNTVVNGMDNLAYGRMVLGSSKKDHITLDYNTTQGAFTGKGADTITLRYKSHLNYYVNGGKGNDVYTIELTRIGSIIRPIVIYDEDGSNKLYINADSDGKYQVKSYMLTRYVRNGEFSCLYLYGTDNRQIGKIIYNNGAVKELRISGKKQKLIMYQHIYVNN